MIKAEISSFDVGDTVECMSGRYKILSFKSALVKSKKVLINSTCINIATGTETIISCRNNKNFVKV